MPAKTPQRSSRASAPTCRKLAADTLVVSDPHAVSWLFNIRGSDVPHTPVALAFAMVPKEGRPTLFVDLRKLGNEIRSRLEEIADVRPNAAFERDLAALGKEHRASAARSGHLPPRRSRGSSPTMAARSCAAADPIAPMKAVKNATEIAGARAAQQRDGAAVTRFLAWFDRDAPARRVDRDRRGRGVGEFPPRDRAAQGRFVSDHRRRRAGRRHRALPRHPQNQSPHRAGELFLLDSGGQYEDGTTDITRTIAVGAPSAEMRRNFTLVLKGHIAIARAVFPDGTTGAQLDTFARQFLWQAGLDFDHGTGHGVGSYLSVHEGPARISKLGGATLKRGMILSERARLLPHRRLRHPHRESDSGDGGRTRSRC